MAKVLCKRTPLTGSQLNFLRAHIMREREKAKEAVGEKPVVATKAFPLTSVSEDSENESPGIGRDKQDIENGSHSTEQGQLGSAASTSSEAVVDTNKTLDRSKESEQETAEDITKQIESLQSHLESLKSEKHRLFQQLKMVLHEEDEKKKMKEMEQKQELEKSLTGGEFPPPIDPRLVQASNLGKHSHPGSPTTATPLMKKQTQRAPLLPTPEGGLFMRQGSSGPYSHQPLDSYHPSTRPPFPPPGSHHFPGAGGQPVPGGGGGGAAVQQRTPYQDQRVAGHAHQETHLQGVHAPGPRPLIPTAQSQVGVGASHGMSYIQQAQFQSHQQGVAIATGYQYTTTSYTTLPNSGGPVGLVQQQQQQQQQQQPLAYVTQQPPQPQQMAPPIPGPHPPQGYQAHMPPPPPHQQVYAAQPLPPPAPGSRDLMMQPAPQGQYHAHEVGIQGHSHYLSKATGAPLVGGSGPSQLVTPYPLHGAGSVQDPRQQRAGMGGAASVLKPVYTKQESHQNSPAPSAVREHKHD